MKTIILFAFIALPLLTHPCVGAAEESYIQDGQASWYGPKFHGRSTASGETYDMYGLTAAHKYLPIGTKVRVTNKRNGKSVVVRINDRGPYIKGRIIDLSKTAAEKIGMLGSGVASVSIESIGMVSGAMAKGDLKGVFLVHLATFSNPALAMQLFDKLEDLSSKRRVLQVINPQGVTAHVQLGPYERLLEAQAALDKLEEPYPEAYVMAELEGTSLRSYLEESGGKREVKRLTAIEERIEKKIEEAEKKAEAAKLAAIEARKELVAAKRAEARRILGTDEKRPGTAIADAEAAGPAPIASEPVATGPVTPVEAGMRKEEALARNVLEEAANEAATLTACKDSVKWTPDLESNDSFYVQLAAYRKELTAKKEVSEAVKKSSVRILQNDAGRRSAYLVQAGPFRGEKSAKERLREFKRRYRDAYVMPASRVKPKQVCVLLFAEREPEKTASNVVGEDWH